MRMTVKRFSIWLVALLVMSASLMPDISLAATTGGSGLPLPRFVSLKAKRVNLRVGPGPDYAVSWLYTRAGLPVEIIQEYDTWRRIRDADGSEGWVFHSLLDGRRSAIAAPWMKGKGADVFVNLRTDPQKEARVVAKLQPGVIITLKECNAEWCRAETDGSEGWVAQEEIWGAYPGEVFK
ncbi:MAG: hypothetical protein RIR97_1447 [Pseudomonadota bacterium]